MRVAWDVQLQDNRGFPVVDAARKLSEVLPHLRVLAADVGVEHGDDVDPLGNGLRPCVIDRS